MSLAARVARLEQAVQQAEPPPLPQISIIVRAKLHQMERRREQYARYGLTPWSRKSLQTFRRIGMVRAPGGSRWFDYDTGIELHYDADRRPLTPETVDFESWISIKAYKAWSAPPDVEPYEPVKDRY